MPDPILKAAAAEIHDILRKYDIAGLVALSSPTAMEFLREVTPSWSCLTFKENPDGSVNVRFRAMGTDYATRDAHKKVVTESTGMIFGFLHHAQQDCAVMEQLAVMLGKHFDITSVITDERSKPDEPLNN